MCAFLARAAIGCSTGCNPDYYLFGSACDCTKSWYKCDKNDGTENLFGDREGVCKLTPLPIGIICAVSALVMFGCMYCCCFKGSCEGMTCGKVVTVHAAQTPLLPKTRAITHSARYDMAKIHGSQRSSSRIPPPPISRIPPPPPGGSDGLPVGWYAALDSSSGKTYYFTKGGETSWERPKGPSDD